jgi:O-antigen/teichoic acid export membrane protein
MADKARFLKHTVIFGIGGTLAQIAPLILFPLYTNYLTPADYGTLDVISQITYIITTVLMVQGITLAVFVFYKQAETEEERRSVAVTLSLFLWLFIGIGVIIAVCGAKYLDVFFRTGGPALLSFGITTALVETLTAIPLALMRARLESVCYVLTTWAMMFARVGLCILFVAVLHRGLWGVFWSSFIVVSISSVILTCREFRLGSLRPDFSKWKDISAFALPFIPICVISFIGDNAGRYMLIRYNPYDDAAAALAAIGLIALAVRLVGMADTFGSSPLRQVWYAVMYDVRKQDDAPYAFGHFALRIFFAHSFFVLGIAVFAPEVIRGICAPSYHNALLLVPIVAVQSLLRTFVGNMEQTYYIERKTHWKILNVCVYAAAIFVFLYFLIQYGITGVCLSMLFAQTAAAVVNYFNTQQFFCVRYPFGRIMLLFGITAAAYWTATSAGNAVSLGNITFEELSEFSKRERILFLLMNLNYPIFLVKAGIIILWFLLVWNSGILSKGDKEFAVSMFNKALHKIPVLRRLSG